MSLYSDQALREQALREEKEEKRRQDQLRQEQLLLEQKGPVQLRKHKKPRKIGSLC